MERYKNSSLYKMMLLLMANGGGSAKIKEVVAC